MKKGTHHSEETRIKISLGNKGKIYSEETRKKMSINNVGMLGKKHTLETIKKLKLRHSGKNHYFYGKHLSIEHRKKISETLKKNNYWRGKNHTEETKKKMSLHNKKTGLGKPCNHGRWGLYKNIFMRSSWEIIYAKWLDKKGYHWIYEPKRFYFEGKNYTYLPDFWVEELNSYVEIKGWLERHPEDKEKLNIFMEKNPLLIINNIKPYKF